MYPSHFSKWQLHFSLSVERIFKAKVPFWILLMQKIKKVLTQHLEFQKKDMASKCAGGVMMQIYKESGEHLENAIWSGSI